MSYLEPLILSIVLMIAIIIDILRFPIIKRDRGSRFFIELIITYSIFLLLTTLINLSKKGILSLPGGLNHLLWALHFLSFPFLLIMWMHFNALNVIGDEKFVKVLTIIHSIPFSLLAVISFIDISLQRFYPFNEGYEHMKQVGGTYFMMGLSLFYCFAMIMPTLGHKKELQGSFLFISVLMPLVFSISLITFWITHTYVMFLLVNSFMIILFYLICQRDSIQIDTLTGLSTEALLRRRLIRIFRSQSSFSIILLEIENYRFFATRHGQLLSDRLLQNIATFLRTLGGANEVFKIANDQFYLCLPDKRDPGAPEIIEKIRERMNQPWELEEIDVYIQVKIAVLNIPSQAKTLEEFNHVTAQLLFEMKMVGKKTMIMYREDFSMSYQRKMNIISALRDSIRCPEQVIVYFQPIYDTKTEKLLSAEALMRIMDKELGFLQPDEFIPLAEQTGIIVELTQIILAKVCQVVKQLHSEKLSIEYIAVNLSAEDFESKIIGTTLLKIIEREQVCAKQIGFEITESVVLQSYETVAKVMMELSMKKITFALDDFGTGYSNFRALMDLPYEYVKIDKTVTQKAPSNPMMLTLLCEMLHKMDKCIIAEGVETKEQLDLARSIGIERIQGYYFSKPLPEKDFLELVRSERTKQEKP